MTTKTTPAAHDTHPPLDWITVKGFRSVASVEKLELRPVNALIGANGAGKTNIVDVFSLLAAVAEGQERLDEYVARSGGANRNLHFGAKATREVVVELSFGNGAERHEVRLAATDGDRLVMVEPVGCDVAARLERWRVHRFHDTAARAVRNAYVTDNQRLREDGRNVAPFLRLLRETEPHAYDRIEKTFRLVVPFFDYFVIEPLARDEHLIRLAWRHVGSDEHFDVAAFSDGSLRFLALATLLLQPARLRPSLVLLDEPELGLHPYAVAMLCSLIRSASVDTQVVLATQSPYLVDQFRPEDIVVVDRVGGASRFTRLSAQALGESLKDHPLGDLWLKNELGGRPAYEGKATAL